ncbi:hypothetical protein GX586_08585 [bacterium]|nr:hypothetical protein [bacterium]
MTACTHAARHGRFNDDDSYTITSSPPGPWCLYLWNAHYLASVDVAARGTGMFKDDEHRRVTLRRAGSPRKVFVRDMRSGEWWDMTDWAKDGDVVVRRGVIEFHRRPAGLELCLSIFVDRVKPMEYWHVSIANRGGRARRFRVFALNHLDVGGFKTRFGNWYSTPGEFDRGANGMLFRCISLERPSDWHNGFLIASRAATGFDGLEANAIGSGSWAAPEIVARGRCTNTPEIGDDRFLAALSIDVPVRQRSAAEAAFVTGVYRRRADAVRIARALRAAPGAAVRERAAVEKLWERKCSAVRVGLPDKAMERIVNYWLPYQLHLNAVWTRIYSHGFRDSLQDAEGVCALDPGRARHNIEQALMHEYPHGRCVRSWGGVEAALKDEFYADSPMWTARAVAAYVKETGDRAFLDARLPFLPDIKTGNPAPPASVYEHVRRALRFLYGDRGAHGLVRIHQGDWCDTMHQAGTQGRGESVWLSIATVDALNHWAGLAGAIGDHAEARACRGMADALSRAIGKHGWDGKWYRAAINDDGMWIGSKANRWGKVFLNPQSWSVLAGINTPGRQRSVLDAIDRKLDSWLGPHLLWPAYREEVKGIGALTGFGPGAIENGSVYSHGACFKIAADCAAGRGDHAYRTWTTIMPGGLADSSPRNTNACGEPFAFTNCRFGLEHPTLAGRANVGAWATGTAAWAFLAATEHILGVQRDYAGLRINPCLPRHWKSARIIRRFRGATYDIRIHNPEGVSTGVVSITVDGTPIKGTTVPACADARRHRVDVVMGEG